MRYILYTDHFSPHELPLFLACAEIFDDAVYVVNRAWPQEASRKEWVPDFKGKRTIVLQDVDPAERSGVFSNLLTSDSTLMYGCYDNPYNELIVKSKGVVIYVSERWLKPLCVRIPLINIMLKIPGIAHLLSLRFVGRMKSIVVRLSNDKDFHYFPQGIYAARDMARLCGLFAGDLRCLFRAPKLDFEKKPGGRIYLASSPLPLPATAKSPLQLPTTTTTKYCLDKMRMWGYFVEPSQLPQSQLPNSSTLKVLWVGRLLNCKRVDTIIRAVGELAQSFSSSNSSVNSHSPITLDIYGTGPEEKQLKKLASRYGDIIQFHGFVAMTEVRKLMRNHGVYVLSSNEYEGWGAVVSEALEEGCPVICSREAGAGATMLPNESLFSCCDHKALLHKLRHPPSCSNIGAWCAKEAAQSLKRFVEG